MLLIGFPRRSPTALREHNESREHPLLAITYATWPGQKVQVDSAQKQPQQHVVAVGQWQQPNCDGTRSNRDEARWAASPAHSTTTRRRQACRVRVLAPPTRTHAHFGEQDAPADQTARHGEDQD